MLTRLFLHSALRSQFSKLSNRTRQEHCEQRDYYRLRSNRGRVTEVQFTCGRKDMLKKQSSTCC